MDDSKESRIGGRKMALRIVGKEKTLQDLEKAQELIKQAHDILYHIPVDIKIEMVCDTEQEQVIDSDLNNQ